MKRKGKRPEPGTASREQESVRRAACAHYLAGFRFLSMALYRYKAVTSAGEILEGQIDVASNDEAVAKIQDAGNIPLEVRAADGADGGSVFGGLFKREPMNQTQVLQFTQQLATLLGAGQPLDRALADPARAAGKRKGQSASSNASAIMCAAAVSLSDALEAEPGVFSRLYVNMVRAGEVGGSLDVTLARLANYLERAKALARKRDQRDDLSGDPRRDGVRRVVRAAGLRRAALPADVQGHERRTADDHQDRAVRRHHSAGLVVADCGRCRFRRGHVAAPPPGRSGGAPGLGCAHADDARRRTADREAGNRASWRARWELC